MRLKHRELARTLEQIESLLKALRAECEGLCYMANENMDSGISGISYDGKSRASGPSDPVSRRATSGHGDRVALDARRFLAGITKARDGLREADRAAWGLRALTQDEARLLSEKDEIANKADQQTIAPQCANPNCDRLGGVTEETRLRGGRCNPCRMYLVRNQMERPRFLCALDTDLIGAEALGLDLGRVIVSASCEDVA